MRLSDKTPAVLFCALLQTSTAVAIAARAPSVDSAAASATAYAAGNSGQLLQGSASLSHDAWSTYYQAGIQALDKRQFEQALPRFDKALNELRKRNISDIRLLKTKEALGRAYLGLEHYDDAVRTLSDVTARLPKFGTTAGAASVSIRAHQGLSEALLYRQNWTKSEDAARTAIKMAEHESVTEPLALARAYLNLGDSLAARSLDEPAGEAYKKALQLCKRASHGDKLDLADTQYHYGLLLRASGHEAQAREEFEQAFAEYDKLALFNKPLAHSSRLNIRWREGNPRARIIPDQDYPLKYTYINGLRVATCLVRSENVIAVLISLANCSRERKELSIGKVSLVQLAPRHKQFRYVHPRELDMTLEAEHVTELTWRRRWLNHIEKTRRIPGYLKDGVLDVDNFFGNNIFGSYGHWQTLAHNETPIVTREQFLYSPYRESARDEADFLSHTPVGTKPTYLDVGDAKTGLVYFGQERFDKALLKIVIGNTVFEFPFDHAGPR